MCSDLRNPNLDSLRFRFKPLKDRYLDPEKCGKEYSAVLRYTMLDAHTLTNRIKLAGYAHYRLVYESRIFPFKDFIHVWAWKTQSKR